MAQHASGNKPDWNKGTCEGMLTRLAKVETIKESTMRTTYMIMVTTQSGAGKSFTLCARSLHLAKIEARKHAYGCPCRIEIYSNGLLSRIDTTPDSRGVWQDMR